MEKVDAPKSGMAWQMQNGPTMMDHWKSIYSKAYRDEHGNIQIDRGSIMHQKAHDAALKAVVLAVAESVSDAIKNNPLSDTAKCPHCDGSGTILGGTIMVCCGYPRPDGSCCGDGVPAQTMEQCQSCAEKS